MRHSTLTGFIAGITLLVGAAASAAPSLGFTETFEGGPNGWTNTTRTGLDHLSSGGVGDTAYVSTAWEASSIGEQGTTIFRGEQSRGASGLAFTGNYLSAGVTELSLSVRHDASEPMGVFVRFAGIANFPGVFFFAPAPIQSGVWTDVSFSIDPANPLFGAEGDPSEWGTMFNSVFSNVANVQVVFTRMPGSELAGPVTFGLDNVSIIPAPGAGASVLLLAGLAGARRRR